MVLHCGVATTTVLIRAAHGKIEKVCLEPVDSTMFLHIFQYKLLVVQSRFLLPLEGASRPQTLRRVLSDQCLTSA